MTTREEQRQTAREMSDADLDAMADGCTELSCMYHGAINEERLARGTHPRQR